MPTRITKAAKDAYIDAITHGTGVTKAAELAGHAPWSFQRVRKAQPAFEARFREAVERGEQVRDDLIRAEIRRRGVEGVEEPVFYQGLVVGHIRRYSDTLLLAQANAHLPEFRDVYLRRDPAAPSTPEAPGLDLSQLTDEELDQLRALTAKARPPLTAVV